MTTEIAKPATFGFLARSSGDDQQQPQSVLGDSLAALLGPRATVPKMSVSKDGIAYAVLGESLTPTGSLSTTKATVIIIGVGYANGLYWPDGKVPEDANAKAPVCASNIASKPELAIGRYRDADNEWAYRNCKGCPYAEFESQEAWTGKPGKGTACSRKIVLAVLPVKRVANMADVARAAGIPNADRLGDYNMYDIDQQLHSDQAGSDFLVARLSIGTNRDVLKQMIAGTNALKRALGVEVLLPEQVAFALTFEAITNGNKKYGIIGTVSPMGIINGDGVYAKVREQAALFQDVFVKVDGGAASDAEVDAATEAEGGTEAERPASDNEVVLPDF